MSNVRRQIGHSLLFVSVLAGFGCSSTNTTDTKSLTISQTKSGNGVLVTMSEPLARSLLEGVIGADLECGADLDSDFAAMLRFLDQEGRGSRTTIRGEDGVVVARRSGRSLKMDVRDGDGGGRLEVKMPWAVAECLLDGSVSLKAKDAGSIKVKVVGSEGGTFEFAVR
jgi:hypothetical protein